MTTIGFLGAGNMARALAGGLKAAAADFRFVASDPDAAALQRFADAIGATTCATNGEVARASDVIVLAVKPQVMSQVLDELAPALDQRHRIVSIAAGIPLRELLAKLGSTARVIRVMPNTPALVGHGMSVLVAGGGASAADLELARQLFAAVGEAVVVEDEALMDAVTAVSGSGPGFLFAFAEAMVEAALRVGLTPELAVALVKQTLFGASALWRGSPESAATLRANVTSPGGTTQAGLEAMCQKGFADAVEAAIVAATARSRELSRRS